MIGEPISAVIVAAISAPRAASPSEIRRTIAARSATGVADQAGKAAVAADTAASTSAAVPAGTLAMTCSVAGLITSIRSDAVSTRAPAMT